MKWNERISQWEKKTTQKNKSDYKNRIIVIIWNEEWKIKAVDHIRMIQNKELIRFWKISHGFMTSSSIQLWQRERERKCSFFIFLTFSRLLKSFFVFGSKFSKQLVNQIEVNSFANFTDLLWKHYLRIDFFAWKVA